MYQGLSKPLEISQKTWDNFWAKVVLSEHGYVWIGAHTGSGYGNFWIPETRKFHNAHRVLYVWANGEFEGVVDHTCSVRKCVTLEHLEGVTQKENTQRTSDRGRHGQYWANQTSCSAGHEYTQENTRMYGNRRKCRTCERDYQYNWKRGYTPQKVIKDLIEG